MKATRAFTLRIAIPVLALAVAAAPPPPAPQSTPEITSAELMEHIRYLADDDLEGRAAGSPGAALAAEYIAAEFERLGLRPVGDGDTFYQRFTVPREQQAAPETTLVAKVGASKLTFRFERDIYPLPPSARGEVEGEAVFAGYGVSAPDLGYDDYAGLDVRGKVVIVLRGVPGAGEGKGPFLEGGADRQYGSFRAKLDLAATLGATGLVVVNDPARHARRSDDVLVQSSSRTQGTIPALQMTHAAGRKLFSKAGLSIARVQRQIDVTLEPVSEPLDKLVIEMKAALEGRDLEVRNVAGLLPSTAQDRIDEVIVIGAHFDHVGRGEFASMGGSKARGEVHNGADDNASGTSAVLELAGFFAPRAEELRRDILFVAFTAEEMGLLGSKQYVGSPLVPLAKTAAMINLDMVGTYKSGGLQVYGAGSSPVFEPLLTKAGQAARLKVRPIRSVGPGNSDHYPFYQKGIPALFFFTGLHKNYHRPSDDWRTIDARGIEKVVQLAAEIALELVDGEARPLFTPTEEGGLEAGPYLGVTVAERNGDVVVADVARGSPAAKLGIRKDDRIVEVNDQEVTSVTIFYGIWAEVGEEDRVSLVLSRDGRVRTLRFKLG
jgi:hypothetical protein